MSLTYNKKRIYLLYLNNLFTIYKTTSKRVIQKTAEATGNLNGNKIADRITNVSKTSPQNKSEKITNEHDK